MTAMGDIEDERRRQVDVECFRSEHDDKYKGFELIRAAVCYAAEWIIPEEGDLDTRLSIVQSELWPWDPDWWKPTDRRRSLVKAAALLVAEIERMDRMEDSDAGTI